MIDRVLAQHEIADSTDGNAYEMLGCDTSNVPRTATLEQGAPLVRYTVRRLSDNTAIENFPAYMLKPRSK